MAEAYRDPQPTPPVRLHLNQDEVDALYTELALSLSTGGRSWNSTEQTRAPLRKIAKAIDPYLTPTRPFPSLPE